MGRRWFKGTASAADLSALHTAFIQTTAFGSIFVDWKVLLQIWARFIFFSLALWCSFKMKYSKILDHRFLNYNIFCQHNLDLKIK